MTNEQKEQVKQLRLLGDGYMKISKKMEISINTIRSYCRRVEMDGALAGNQVRCKQCNRAIKVVPKQKPRVFCSDACRARWWNSHQDLVDRKAYYIFVCANCGETFTAYGNDHRKYCSRKCYISGRYGKGNANMKATNDMRGCK